MLILDTFNIFLVVIIDVYISSDISTNLLLLWIMASMILFFFHSKFDGLNDELTERIMSKVSAICIKYMIPMVIFMGILVTQRNSLSIVLSTREIVGLVIISSMFIFSALRVLLFMHYERKVIY
ncbi:hypothetical protein EAI30_16745 [Romboutsia ilealis]|nr:hypothetical protein [Romboutsia ilealis]